ncbi:MAG: hypothetical protein LBS52_03370 [Dysgonamonadaceae bacterium]|nr:hypothetical protein [Dysgonamonadaceae bacterium]
MTVVGCPPIPEGTVQYIIDDGVLVKEGDIVCKIEVPTFQTQYDEVEANLESSRAAYNLLQARLAMERAVLEAQIRDNDAQTLLAGLDSLQLSYMADNEARIKRLELERNAINRARFDKKLKALEVMQQSDLKKMDLQIKQSERGLENIKKQIDNLTLKAPKDGMALRGLNRSNGIKLKVGDKVYNRMTLVSIPDVSDMKVLISAAEMEFKNINVNDSVIYSFDAMPDNVGYGKITAKKPIGSGQNRTVFFSGGGVTIVMSSAGDQSKVKFFDVEASLDSVMQMPEAGFSARCQIILKEVKDTIVVPQVAVYDEDSVKVVFVARRGGGFEMREVLTGLSSPKETIISDGLREGEVISLLRPSSAHVKKKTFLTKETPVDTSAVARLPLNVTDSEIQVARNYSEIKQCKI